MYHRELFQKKLSQKSSRLARLLTFCALCTFLSGCVSVLIGTGIVAGFGLSNDAAAGNVSVGYNRLWNTCLDVFQVEGLEIVSSKESDGLIKAASDNYKYAVKISSLDQDTQRLKISARKYLIPKPYKAQDIFMKIVQELE